MTPLWEWVFKQRLQWGNDIEKRCHRRPSWKQDVVFTWRKPSWREGEILQKRPKGKTVPMSIAFIGLKARLSPAIFLPSHAKRSCQYQLSPPTKDLQRVATALAPRYRPSSRSTTSGALNLHPRDWIGEGEGEREEYIPSPAHYSPPTWSSYGAKRRHERTSAWIESAACCKRPPYGTTTAFTSGKLPTSPSLHLQPPSIAGSPTRQRLVK